MSEWLFALGLLALVYVLALGRAGSWDFLIGALLAALLLVVFRTRVSLMSRPGRPGFFSRMAAFPPFIAVVAVDVLRGTWDVARVVVGFKQLERSGIVAIPFGERSPQGVAVSALVMTLSPGSVLVDIDPGEAVMYFHFLDASDPDGLRQAHERFYQRYQRRIFP